LATGGAGDRDRGFRLSPGAHSAGTPRGAGNHERREGGGEPGQGPVLGVEGLGGGDPFKAGLGCFLGWGGGPRAGPAKNWPRAVGNPFFSRRGTFRPPPSANCKKKRALFLAASFLDVSRQGRYMGGVFVKIFKRGGGGGTPPARGGTSVVVSSFRGPARGGNLRKKKTFPAGRFFFWRRCWGGTDPPRRGGGRFS